MEEKNISQPPKKTVKRRGYSVARLDKDFMRKISRLAERANKKRFGRRVRSKDILESLFSLADDSLLDQVVKKAQENSLSLDDKREAFLKERLGKFDGSKETIGT